MELTEFRQITQSMLDVMTLELKSSKYIQYNLQWFLSSPDFILEISAIGE